MSSYLLAFCIGEFDFVQGSTKEGRVSVRVYTPPGKSHLGTFALEVAEKTLDLYDDFFQERYPLPKLDMVRGRRRKTLGGGRGESSRNIRVWVEWNEMGKGDENI